jgi:DNA adenine methylase
MGMQSEQSEFVDPMLELKEAVPPEMKRYPVIQYRGSKRRLIPQLSQIFSMFEPETALDLFSGTGHVSYLLKLQGVTVYANDYMVMASKFARAMIENSGITLSETEARALLERNAPTDDFVQNNFQGLYFHDEENELIDILRANIKTLEDPYKRAIALTALCWVCIRLRNFGHFSYTGFQLEKHGQRPQMMFRELFLEKVGQVNKAPFDSGKACYALNEDALDAYIYFTPDVVYIDPPYYSQKSCCNYSAYYHFVEGIARDWWDVEIQHDSKTKKFEPYPDLFRNKNSAQKSLDTLFQRYQDSVLIVSQSSHCELCLEEMVEMLRKYKRNVEVESHSMTYHVGGPPKNNPNNRVQEYIFVAY